MIIYPYKNGSLSVKDLKEKLGCKEIKTEGSKFRGRRGQVVLNWGATKYPEVVARLRVLNDKAAVSKAVDKIKTFTALAEAGCSIPPFTFDINEAKAWIEEGASVCCRTIVNGREGNGLVLADTKDQVVAAPLYTRYIKKKEEYRIHVFAGEVIHVQRKALRKLEEGQERLGDLRIRNTAGGYVFQMNLPEAPNEEVSAQAVKAVAALGLDFGAVDMIWNNKQQKAYILEVNTAPGIEGTTVDKYAEAIKKLVNQ